MRNEPARELALLLAAEPAEALLADPPRCHAALRQRCAQLPGRDGFQPECSLLHLAHEAGVPHRLHDAARVCQEMRRLQQTHEVQPAAAKWAVEAWARALGVIDAAVPCGPQILEFDATPHDITDDAPIQFAWTVAGTPTEAEIRCGTWAQEVTGRTSIRLDPRRLPSADPAADTARIPCRLTVRDAYGEDTREIVLRVTRPRILEFRLPTHDRLAEGDSIRIEWEVQHARRIEIVPGIGDVSDEPVGTREVTIGRGDQRFILHAEGPTGPPVEDRLELEVVRITRFEPRRPLVSAEPPYTHGGCPLEWSVTYAAYVELSGVGAVEREGRYVVPPGTPAQPFTLRAHVRAGKVLEKTVTLQAARLLDAPRRVFGVAGHPLELRWEAEHARRAFIEGYGECAALDSARITLRPDTPAVTLVLIGDVNVIRHEIGIILEDLSEMEALFPPPPAGLLRAPVPALETAPPALDPLAAARPPGAFDAWLASAPPFDLDVPFPSETRKTRRRPFGSARNVWGRLLAKEDARDE